MDEKLFKKIKEIQTKLHAPKDRENKFGGFMYRSLPQLLQLVKPMLGDDYILGFHDELIALEGRVFFKVTFMISDKEDNQFQSHGYAEMGKNQKGMNQGQLSGSTSSFAAKYAVEKMFGIDDSKSLDEPKPDDNDVSNKTTDDLKRMVAKLRPLEQLATIAITLFKKDLKELTKDELIKLYNEVK